MCVSRMCTSDLNKWRTGCLGINRNDIVCWHMLFPPCAFPEVINLASRGMMLHSRVVNHGSVSRSGEVAGERLQLIPWIGCSEGPVFAVDWSLQAAKCYGCN